MIYDFRPSAEPEDHANAKRAMSGLCFWNGAEMKDVCYADTEAGTLGLVCRNFYGQAFRGEDGFVVLHWMRGGTVTVIESPSEMLAVSEQRGLRAYDLDAECVAVR